MDLKSKRLYTLLTGLPFINYRETYLYFEKNLNGSASDACKENTRRLIEAALFVFSIGELIQILHDIRSKIMKM